MDPLEDTTRGLFQVWVIVQGGTLSLSNVFTGVKVSQHLPHMQSKKACSLPIMQAIDDFTKEFVAKFPAGLVQSRRLLRYAIARGETLPPREIAEMRVYNHKLV